MAHLSRLYRAHAWRSRSGVAPMNALTESLAALGLLLCAAVLLGFVPAVLP
jgi:hypothetical protein